MLTSTAFAQVWTESAELIYGWGLRNTGNPACGRALWSDGAMLISGDQMHNTTNGEPNAVGRVFVFTNGTGGWVQSQIVTKALDHWKTNGWFGYVLDYDHPWLAVGSTANVTNGHYSPVDHQTRARKGSVEVFKFVEGSRQFEPYQFISDVDYLDPDSEFGNGVRISGNWMLISAPWWDNLDGSNAVGRIWFYELVGDTWTKKQILESPIQADYAQWGYQYDLDGTNAVAFCATNIYGNSWAWLVYWLTLEGGTTWSNRAAIWYENWPIAGDDPSCLLLHQGTNLVWTLNHSFAPYGTTFFFNLQDGSWVQTGSWSPSTAEFHDRFGLTLEATGDYLVIGDRYSDDEQPPNDSYNRPARGRAYVLKRNGFTWNYVQTLRPLSLTTNDLFGSDVAVGTNGHVFVSASSGWRNVQKVIVTYEFRLHDQGIEVKKVDLLPQLKIAGKVGANYDLEYQDNLISGGDWVSLDTVTLDGNPQFYYDDSAVGHSRRFYRLASVTESSALGMAMVPRLVLEAEPVNDYRLEYREIRSQSTNWLFRDFIAITNNPQFYYDTSAVGQPPRVYLLSLTNMP